MENCFPKIFGKEIAELQNKTGKNIKNIENQLNNYCNADTLLSKDQLRKKFENYKNIYDHIKDKNKKEVSDFFTNKKRKQIERAAQNLEDFNEGLQQYELNREEIANYAEVSELVYSQLESNNDLKIRWTGLLNNFQRQKQKIEEIESSEYFPALLADKAICHKYLRFMHNAVNDRAPITSHAVPFYVECSKNMQQFRGAYEQVAALVFTGKILDNDKPFAELLPDCEKAEKSFLCGFGQKNVKNVRQFNDACNSIPMTSNEGDQSGEHFLSIQPDDIIEESDPAGELSSHKQQKSFEAYLSEQIANLSGRDDLLDRAALQDEEKLHPALNNFRECEYVEEFSRFYLTGPFEFQLYEKSLQDLAKKEAYGEMKDILNILSDFVAQLQKGFKKYKSVLEAIDQFCSKNSTNYTKSLETSIPSLENSLEKSRGEINFFKRDIKTYAKIIAQFTGSLLDLKPMKEFLDKIATALKTIPAEKLKLKVQDT